MTTPELERVLAETFRSHAEEAMTNTDTRTEHERLEARLAEEAPRRRRHVVAGALAASAATVAAAVWVADVAMDGDSDPVQPSAEQTPAERVADEFSSAFAADDAALASSYVAPGTPSWRQMRSDMRTDDAWRMEYLMQPCQELSTSAAGTNVVCGFDYYTLGSKELGLEPFGQNSLTLRISDGQVAFTELTANVANNGHEELFISLGEWVMDNYPGEWSFMVNAEGHTPAEMDRWHRLWERRIDGYVADRLG